MSEARTSSSPLFKFGKYNASHGFHTPPTFCPPCQELDPLPAKPGGWIGQSTDLTSSHSMGFRTNHGTQLLVVATALVDGW